MLTSKQSDSGWMNITPSSPRGAEETRTSTTPPASPSTDEHSVRRTKLRGSLDLPEPGERYVTYTLPELYPSWHSQANCLGQDESLFFGASDPDQRPPYNLSDIKRAKAMCGGCPVAAQCLRAALEYRDEYGVWAGTTRKSRKKILKAVDAGVTTIDAVVEAFKEARDAK